jgi:peptidoglycan/LPS O-acetylase OafA/YrhL
MPHMIVLLIGGLAALIVATLLAGSFARYGFPLQPLDRRIGCIDGLRGYLALSVMIHHFIIAMLVERTGVEWGPIHVTFLDNLGKVGVALFFNITGFVFYPRILVGFRATSWISVAINRIFRIVPLVAVSVVMVTIIILVCFGGRIDFGYLIGAATWISGKEVDLLSHPISLRINAGVLWSIRLEWLFYLIVLPGSAVAIDILRSHRLPTWIVPLGLLMLTFVFRLAGFHFGHASIRFVSLFAVGMLAFEVQSRPGIRSLLANRINAIPAIAALVIGMAFAPTPYGVIALPLYAFFFACVACGNSLGGFLQTKGALVLGECSFGIYLLHGIVIFGLFETFRSAFAARPIDDFPAILPLIAILVVALTGATYLAIERPAMAKGKLLARWAVGRKAVPWSREIEVAP